MGWCKTKRLILNKPYLIDPYRQISFQEAKHIWLKTGYPCDEELLNRACLIAGKTQAEWSFLFPRKRYRKQTLFRRPLIVVYAIVLVFITFLTFTIPGRAFAKNIYDTISKIIENILYIRPEETDFPDDSYILPEDIPSHDNKEKGTKEFKNLKETQEYIGKRIVFLDNLKYTATDIIVKESPISGTILEFSYSNESGFSISMVQQWTDNANKRVLSIDISNADYHKRELPMGFSIEGLLTEDNTYTGFAILGDIVFTISIYSEALSWDDINAILDNLNYYGKSK